MAASIESPYYDGPGAIWLRGNLHTHSTRSDGALSPQDTVNKYVALGYDFLMLSDHDTLGEPETLDGQKMLLIRGNEISAGGSHLLHIGATKRLEPCPDRQQVIDAINADGGLAILCHPNWTKNFNHYTYEQLLALNNYAGIEILNGTCIRLAGEAKATDKWDRLLAAGKKVWGYGNDDMHKEHEQALSWTVVRARERSVPAVLEALRNGSCYVSSGIEIQQIRCTGSVLHVFAPTAQAMAVFGDCGARLHYQLGNEIYFDLADLQANYVRVECYGLGGQMAWTQPLYIRGGKADYLRKLAEDKPLLRASQARSVKLTGRMDDPAWQATEGSSRFLSSGTGDLPTAETMVKCLLTSDRLVFGIRCDEPQMDQLKTNVTADGDPNTWNDDSVEIFLDSGSGGKQYLHAMISAAGYGYSVWMPDGAKGPVLQIVASRDAVGWTAEVAVPLSAFTSQPEAGGDWGLHVCRNRKPGNATYFWAWVGSNNHTPARYGRLIFD